MIKKNLVVLFFAFSCFAMLAHDEYKRTCEQQKEYEQKKKEYENAPFGKWPPSVPTIKIKYYNSKIQECKTRRELIENNHIIRIKHIIISDIPDVDSWKYGHADLRIFHDKQLIYEMNNCQTMVEFSCDIKIKSGEILRISDKDLTDSEDIGRIPLSRVVEEILQRKETQGRILFNPPSLIQGESPCKVEIFYEVKNRKQ